VRVNGQVVAIPANTIVILPTNALTWDELFTEAPAPYSPSQTGLAMFDRFRRPCRPNAPNTAAIASVAVAAICLVCSRQGVP
jgi:hypothetical protein